MPAGREVTDRHLEAFRMWGVPSIEIEGEEDTEAPTPDLDPDVLAVAEDRVSELFALAGADHPFLRALMDIARVRVARELQRLRGGTP